MNNRNRLECVRALSFVFPFTDRHARGAVGVGSLAAVTLLAAVPAFAQETTTRNERLGLSPQSSSSGQLFGSAVAGTAWIGQSAAGVAARP